MGTSRQPGDESTADRRDRVPLKVTARFAPLDAERREEAVQLLVELLAGWTQPADVEADDDVEAGAEMDGAA